MKTHLFQATLFFSKKAIYATQPMGLIIAGGIATLLVERRVKLKELEGTDFVDT